MVLAKGMVRVGMCQKKIHLKLSQVAFLAVIKIQCGIPFVYESLVMEKLFNLLRALHRPRHLHWKSKGGTT